MLFWQLLNTADFVYVSNSCTMYDLLVRHIDFLTSLCFVQVKVKVLFELLLLGPADVLLLLALLGQGLLLVPRLR